MSDPISGDVTQSLCESDEEILAEFIRELERRDREALDLADWVRRYPHLTMQFKDAINSRKMHDRLAEAGVDELPQIPERIGDFRIERLIAVGGMGAVYEAEQESLKRRVAVKTIRDGEFSEEARMRFDRERLVLARLHQTNIVPIHTAGREDGVQYFVMPCIDGVSLRQILRHAGATSMNETATPPIRDLVKLAANRGQDSDDPFETQGERIRRRPDSLMEYYRSVARVLSDVATAVEHAHSVQVLHRDIKPSNIMVDTKEHAWIIDFGLARYVRKKDTAGGRDANRANQPQDRSATDEITHGNGHVGTPRYMAPEQFDADSDDVDARTDVWGLGATLYELLTLSPPFRAESASDYRHLIRETSPRQPRSIESAIPRDLEAICMKALQKNRANRYSTSAEFAADLRRWLNDEPTQARPPSALRRFWKWSRRNKGWATALAIAFMSLAAGAVVAFSAFRNERGEATAAKRQLARHQRTEAVDRMVGMRATRLQTLHREATSVRFHPSGGRLLVGGKGAVATQRESGTGGLLLKLDSRESSSFQFSANGPVAFTAEGDAVQLVDADRKLQLINLETEKIVAHLDLPKTGDPKSAYGAPEITPGAPRTVDMSDAAKTAVAILPPTDKTRRGVVAVWHPRNGVIAPATIPRDASTIAVSPDGRLIAVAEKRSNDVSIWSAETGRMLVDRVTSSRLPIHALAFGKNPSVESRRPQPKKTEDWLLAVGNAGGRITVWNPLHREPISTCVGGVYGVTTMSFSPDGTMLASAGRVRPWIWDVATGRALLKLPYTNTMTDIEFSPNGRRIAVASMSAFRYTGRVDVWELSNGNGVRGYYGLRTSPQRLVLSPDGRFLAGLSQYWNVAIWEVRTGRLVRVFTPKPGRYVDNAGMAFNRDGSLFGFSSGREIALWNLKSGRPLRKWTVPPGLQDQLVFSARNDLVSFRAETRSRLPFSRPWRDHPRVCRIRRFQVDHALPVSSADCPTDVRRSVVLAQSSPDGKCFAVEGVGGAEGDHRIFALIEADTGKELFAMPSRHPLKAGASFLFTSSSKLVYHGGPSEAVLIDVSERRVIRGKLPVNVNAIDSQTEIAAMPGPQSSETGDQLGMQLSRFGSRSPLLTFVNRTAVTGGQGTVFSQNGRMLFWGTSDGTVYVADLSQVRRELARLDLDWDD